MSAAVPGPSRLTSSRRSRAARLAYGTRLSPITSPPLRGAAGTVERGQHTLGGHRLLGEHRAERRERIVDGVEDRGGRARGPALSRALLASGDARRRRLEMVALDRRQVGGG